jgi:hypothetical protein
MHSIDCIVSVWIILTLPISLLLCFTIIKFIGDKATVRLTIVDLIYKDSIVYIYLLCFSTYLGILCCIVSDNAKHSLNFEVSLIFAILISIFLFCISISFIISGLLRLFTLLKLSEEWGIQLLGPDDLAVFKIRTMSIVISTIIAVSTIVFYKEYPTTVDLFHGNEEFSKRQSNLIVKSIYSALPRLALIVNCVTKFYSVWVNFKLNRVTQIKIGQLDLQDNSYAVKIESFALSMNSVMALIFVFFVLALSQFSERHIRLYYIVPADLMCICVVVPLFIIMRTEKMRNILVSLFPLEELSLLLLIFKKRNVLRTAVVHPD